MQRPLRRAASGLLLFVAGERSHQPASSHVWQADIQIRTLEITKGKTSMNARVVIYSENDDAALNARLLILLPVGVGVERVDPGCAASPGPSMVPSLRAMVSCEIGAIPNRGF